MGRFLSSRIAFFIGVVGFLFWVQTARAQCGEEGIIVNEFSNGPSGTVEYLELVVVGCPSATVDIREWIFDDNNGDFSGGPSSGEGIAPGHIRFKNVALWQSVAVGSIIVVYNQTDKNSSIPADDPTDSNGDLVYILPANNSNLEGCNTDPDFQNADYNCSYGTATWNSMSFRNGGDVAQTRQPNGSYFHGLSYGSGGDGFDGGPDGIHFPGSGSGHNYYFNNTTDDYRSVGNFTRGNAPGDETPGEPNNTENGTWLNNLQNPGAPTDPNLRVASSTCTEAVLTVDNFCAYNWENGAGTNQTFTVTTTGNYTVTVTDINGCQFTNDIDVTVGGNLDVSLNVAPNPACSGQTVTATVGGSDASGATFDWSLSGGARQGGASGNPKAYIFNTSGSYTISVTVNNAGCTETFSESITVNPLPTPDLGPDVAVCTDATPVTLDAGSYASYSWSPNGETSQTIDVSTSGTYSVTVTDANGCQGTDAVDVTVNPLPTVSIAADDAALCEGETTELTASGADSYVWEDGSTTNPRTVAPTSTTTYSVTGTDANGCENTDAITITVNPLPTVAIGQTPNPVCEGENATLQVTLSSGASFTWDDDNSNTNPRSIINPTNNQSFSVTAVDGNGCQNTASIAIQVTPVPAAPADQNLSYCLNDFASQLTPNGNNFQWFDASMNLLPEAPTPNTSTAGTTTYYVREVDPNGNCASPEATVTVTVNNAQGISIAPSKEPLCDGENVTLTVSFASGSFTWDDDNSSTNPRTIVQPSDGETYTATLNDANSCANSDTYTITVNPLPTVGIAANDESICEGETATLTASGADSYVWEDGSTTNPRMVTPANTTTYSVTGTDANGCENVDDITVTVNPLPNVSAIALPATICVGESSSLNASGATNYVWEDNFSAPNPRSVSPNSNTTYRVVGTDNNGCSSAGSVTVSVNPLPTVAISAGNTEICTGESTSLSASGADAYAWEDGSTANPRTVSPTSTITYSVTGTDANGCENMDDITVTVNPLPNVSVTANPTAVCEGESSTLQATGAAGYVWEDDNSTNNPRTVTPPNTTIYTVTGTEANGCSAQASASVNVKPVPPKPQDQSDTFCQFDRIGQLQPNTVDYVWYDENIDPLPEAPKPDSSVVGSVQYFFQQENNGCFSPLASYEVTIKPKPNAFLPQSRVDCQFDTPAQLEPNGPNFVWYDSNGNTLASAPTPSTDVAGVTQFTFRRELNGCFSDATDFTYTVNPKPAKPQEQTIDYCFEASASQLQPNTANYQWYDANQNALPQAPTPNTTNEGEQQFYYSETSNGCESDLASVVVRVAEEIPPFAGYTTRYCQFETPVAINPGQGTANWFDENGNALGSENPVPSTDVPGITSYFATKEFAGCTSEESEFMVEVIARPNTPATGTDTLFYCQQDAANPLTPRLGNHTWYRESGSSLGNSHTPSTAVVDTSTFYVSVTENGCESLRDSVVVVIKEKPQAPVTSNTGPYCQEDIATPLQPNGAGYTWFLFDNGTNQYINQGNTTTPATNTSGSHKYQVTYTENGCTSDATLVSVTIKPKPVAPQVANLRYCVGESAAPLTATAGAGNTVTWYNVNKQALSNTPTPSTTEADTLHYFATQTQNGCLSDFSDTLKVLVHALPTIDATVQGACPGDAFTVDIEFTGEPNFDFDVVNTSNQNTTNYSASSTETTVSLNVPNGTYKLRLNEDAFCNAAQDAVIPLNLNHFEVPQATLSLNEDPCLQETYVVANFTGNPNFSFVWDVSGAAQQTRTIGETSDSILVMQPGMVRLLQVSDANCQASSNPQINVPKTNYNTPSLMALENTVCEGSTISVTVSNLEPGMETVVRLDGQEYLLTLSDIITLPNLAPGCYNAEVFATDATRGCSTDTLTWEDLLCVQENPESNFKLRPNISFQEATNRVVENTSFGADSYVWRVNDEQVSDRFNLAYDFTDFQRDTAVVCLEAYIQASNSLTCADTVCKPINVASGAPVYIPDAFTPDANVLNESWGPVSDGAFDYYELEVYDRWGKVVFESKAIGERWNGTLKGELARPGIYAYILKYRYANEIGEHRIHGDVKVIR